MRLNVHLNEECFSSQVILLGVSYGAGAALFSMTYKHPAVVASVLLYPFWDLYNDISCPGGVPHHKFVGNWNRICQALDHNNVGGLAKLLRVFCTCVPLPDNKCMHCTVSSTTLFYTNLDIINCFSILKFGNADLIPSGHVKHKSPGCHAELGQQMNILFTMSRQGTCALQWGAAGG